jgi:large subunit ribosomal protein L4
MKIPVHNISGSEVGTVELPPGIFETKIKRGLMHQALVRQLANARRGTHKAKSRSEVSLTTAKWYRQKGTGRARHGSKRAPIFVGGGVAHGPQVRSHARKMPRKMRRAALRSALSAKAMEGAILVVDELSIDAPKTRDMAAIIERLADSRSTLLLLAERDEKVEFAVRNLAGAKTLRANYLNIRDLLGHHKVVISLSALEVIQGFLGQGESTIVVAELNVEDATEDEEE